MTQASGPQGFFKNFEAEAERITQDILRRAKGSYESRLTINLSVEFGAKPLLVEKLKAHGFTSVEFHSDQREGAWIELEGNPFAAGNVEQEAQLYVSQINQMLNRAHLSDNSITLSISVPTPVQDAVRDAYRKAGWSNVKFGSSQRDGSWMTLTV